MSVLIEAISIVIPRLNLDISYPGGSEALIAWARDPKVKARYVCADDQLVSVSFFGQEDLSEFAKPLLNAGFIEAADRKFVDLAILDQRFGPTLPCDWLEWKRHRDGYTSAWMTGMKPGKLAAPDGWTPEQSRRLSPSDMRTEPGRAMQLAEVDGFETWLDLQTGRVTEGLPQRKPEAAEVDAASSEPGQKLEKPSVGPLLSIVRRALDARKVRYHTKRQHSAVRFKLMGEHSGYDCLVITDEVHEIVFCYATTAAVVPEAMRSAAAELITRANFGMRIGNFEMDYSDGEVRFRTSVDVEGGRFAARMLDTMVAASLGTYDRYYPALMKVVYGSANPSEAIAEIEGSS